MTGSASRRLSERRSDKFSVPPAAVIAEMFAPASQKPIGQVNQLSTGMPGSTGQNQPAEDLKKSTIYN